MTDSAQIPDLVFCAECSRLVGEQVFGTAPRVDVWIMLEYTGPWNAKALPQSDLPAEIKAHIDGWMNRLPNNKFQFVKQHDSKATPDCTLFVALTRERDPRLFEFPPAQDAAVHGLHQRPARRRVQQVWTAGLRRGAARRRRDGLAVDAPGRPPFRG